MAVLVAPIDRVSFRTVVACGVVLRAALGLIALGLTRPFAPAVIQPRTGKVRPR